MACGSCNRKRNITAQKRKMMEESVLGGYKYLPERQLKARLETYKRKYCKDCKKRYDCDYPSYVQCKKPTQ